MGDGLFPRVSLAECGVTLYDCEHATPPDEGEGYPYLAIPNLKDGRLDLTNVRRISREQLSKWNRRVTPRGGDIILTRRGRVGDTAVVPDDLECTIGQNLVILRSEENVIDQTFLRWALRGPHYDAEVQRLLNVGAVFNSLNCSDIPKICVAVPPIAEQREIAEVLGALDEKIESNRRIASTCIRLAQILLSAGDDEVRVGECAVIEKGLSYKGAGLTDKGSGTPMFNLKNFGTSGWLELSSTKFYSGEFKEKHIVRPGYLIVANTDLTQQRVILGRPALVPPLPDVGIITHHVFAVRCEDLTIRLALWAQLNGSGFRERAEGFATGTTVASMPADALTDFMVSIPQRTQVAEAETLINRAWAAETESETLATTRDLLLPRLLTGRLRVRDAEQAVGEAL